MTDDAPQPKLPRVLLTSFPESYVLSARPANASAIVADAHRQTGFILGEELAIFERALTLQLRIVEENAKVRGARGAGMFTLWARTFAHLADACQLMSQGSYVSCAPLARMALESIAAQKSLVRDGFAEYEGWFAQAVSQDKTNAAILIEKGNYKAASVFAKDERLGTLYRLLMELSMPHFGSSLLLAAAETSLQKAPLTFADGAFHLGWAELVTSWLLLLAGEQIGVARESGVFVISDGLAADCDSTLRVTRGALANRRRCHVEAEGGRFVFHSFRRAASGQPKRVVLG
ncbi:MAG: hypothetical protein ABI559_01880 [Chloroflexota bacterium]